MNLSLLPTKSVYFTVKGLRHLYGIVPRYRKGKIIAYNFYVTNRKDKNVCYYISINRLEKYNNRQINNIVKHFNNKISVRYVIKRDYFTNVWNKVSKNDDVIVKNEMLNG